ncbi:hypothetical protein [Algoriphagus boritolerans]|uniref:hypothetical protein n=1 Tax=Algoriphagus boritolerans TaxID=308111 RepID=UPI000A6B7CED
MANWLKLIISLALPQLVGGLGAFFYFFFSENLVSNPDQAGLESTELVVWSSLDFALYPDGNRMFSDLEK